MPTATAETANTNRPTATASQVHPRAKVPIPVVPVTCAHLLYGEWLRRANCRTDAREQLRTAHDLLSAIGMEAFAERASRELSATGETARKRTALATVEADHELTAQEAQVAQLARDGLSNPEIGARPFISAHTVQYHLGKVFTKLGISSRGQLHRVPPGRLDTPGR
ncbi:MAG: helix-turn-helix transcriptional regulator [Streptosporangiaceae bacterium]